MNDDLMNLNVLRDLGPMAPVDRAAAAQALLETAARLLADEQGAEAAAERIEDAARRLRLECGR